EKVYAEIPLAFKRRGSSRKFKVICLKKNLYGLHQSPCVFWKYITKKLDNCGLPQALLDPCLFIGEKDVAMCYDDDVIFWATNEKDIFDMAIQLHAEGVDVEQEDNAAGVLGVQLKQYPKTGFLNMVQKGLIKQVLKTIGLKVGTANETLPTVKGKPLCKHVHGEPVSGDFNHSSVIRMLMYLVGHTHLDIIDAINCAGRYMFYQKIVINMPSSKLVPI
ncbi:hypothetical protein ACHAXS_000207, partial [Conticribra weissflogii]